MGSEAMPENASSSMIVHTYPRCTSLNDYLWETARDPTTQPSVWAIFAFFYAVIIVTGISGNLCVILAISRTKQVHYCFG